MITFHPFNRWCAIAIDGEPMGYMSHFDGKTTLFLRQDAPKWQRDVRAQGPWKGLHECCDAFKAAYLEQSIARPPFVLTSNVLQFPPQEKRP